MPAKQDADLSEPPCEMKLRPRTRSFTARFESLDTVREFVSLAAEEYGLDAKAIYAVELATDEAFTNIVEHAYGGESSEQVECTCEFTVDRLIIILHDCGLPFDPTLVPEPDLDAPLEERETGGLGIFFMRKLMDEVHFSPGSKKTGNCNTLTMIKYKEKAG
jgi:anti-sigma regulatory factor (Ser/Thr protein kinase)